MRPMEFLHKSVRDGASSPVEEEMDSGVAVDVAEDVDVGTLLSSSSSADQLKSYFRRIPTPAYLWRRVGGDFSLEAVNDAALTATGGRALKLLGIPSTELYADRPDIVEDIRRGGEGDTFTREMRYVSKSTGREQEVVATFVHLPPDAVAVHAREVTEERRAHRELLDSREAIRAVLEASPHPIFTVDSDGDIVEANTALGTSLGLGGRDLVGEHLFDLLPPDLAARGRSTLEEVIRTERPLRFEESWRDRHFDIRVYPVPAAEGASRVVVYAEEITARKRVEMAERRSHELLRALTQHLESVRETERAQIARDLHDHLGSILTALKLEIELLARRHPDRAEDLAQLVDLIQRGIDTKRRLIVRLRPEVLDDLGLVSALEWLGEDIARHAKIECAFDLPEEEPALREPLVTGLFRLAQEALTNVMRHANATQVLIRLTITEKSVALEVTDDGVGFNTSVSRERSFGIVGMDERARALGGECEVDSEPAGGTTVSVTLPLQ